MRVFIIPVHVYRKNKPSAMPEGYSGAYAKCFSVGNDYVEATKNALKSLAQEGMYPKEILQPIHEMDAMEWSQYILDSWPEQVDSMLNQTEFENAMKNNEVVYGPFGLYE
jgi:hypothetical protein